MQWTLLQSSVRFDNRPRNSRATLAWIFQISPAFDQRFNLLVWRRQPREKPTKIKPASTPSIGATHKTRPAAGRSTSGTALSGPLVGRPDGRTGRRAFIGRSYVRPGGLIVAVDFSTVSRENLTIHHLYLNQQRALNFRFASLAEETDERRKEPRISPAVEPFNGAPYWILRIVAPSGNR